MVFKERAFFVFESRTYFVLRKQNVFRTGKQHVTQKSVVSERSRTFIRPSADIC